MIRLFEFHAGCGVIKRGFSFLGRKDFLCKQVMLLGGRIAKRKRDRITTEESAIPKQTVPLCEEAKSYLSSKLCSLDHCSQPAEWYCALYTIIIYLSSPRGASWGSLELCAVLSANEFRVGFRVWCSARSNVSRPKSLAVLIHFAN